MHVHTNCLLFVKKKEKTKCTVFWIKNTLHPTSLIKKYLSLDRVPPPLSIFLIPTLYRIFQARLEDISGLPQEKYLSREFTFHKKEEEIASVEVPKKKKSKAMFRNSLRWTLLIDNMWQHWSEHTNYTNAVQSLFKLNFFRFSDRLKLQNYKKMLWIYVSISMYGILNLLNYCNAWLQL